MFNLVENRYLKDGIVKYLDENNNRLMIISDKERKELRIKVRPVDKNVTVKRIVLKKPLNKIEGIHFELDIDADADMINIEEIKNKKMLEMESMLSEAIMKIENWIVILEIIDILTNNSIPLDEKTTIELLSELKEYEEMDEFVNTYLKLLNL